MRFADELRGSEGERCVVTDLRTGICHQGVIVAWNDETQKADVQYDSGPLVRVGYSFVRLIEDEPA
jgi:hypothetical protein